MNSRTRRFYHLKKALDSLKKESDEQSPTLETFTHTRPLSSNPIQIQIITTRKTGKPKKYNVPMKVNTSTQSKKKVKKSKSETTIKQTTSKPINSSHQIHKNKVHQQKENQLQSQTIRRKPAATKQKKSPIRTHREYDDINKKFETFCKAKQLMRSISSLYFMKWYRKTCQRVYNRRDEINYEKVKSRKNTQQLSESSDADSSFILMINSDNNIKNGFDNDDNEIQDQYKGFNRFTSEIQDDVISDIFDDNYPITLDKDKRKKKKDQSKMLEKSFLNWKSQFESHELERNAINEASINSFISNQGSKPPKHSSNYEKAQNRLDNNSNTYIPNKTISNMIYFDQDINPPSQGNKLYTKQTHYDKQKVNHEKQISQDINKNRKIIYDLENTQFSPDYEDYENSYKKYVYDTKTDLFNAPSRPKLIHKPSDDEYKDYIKQDQYIPQRPKLINEEMTNDIDLDYYQAYKTPPKRPKLIKDQENISKANFKQIKAQQYNKEEYSDSSKSSDDEFGENIILQRQKRFEEHQRLIQQ